jgi:hypothetical protein
MAHLDRADLSKGGEENQERDQGVTAGNAALAEGKRLGQRWRGEPHRADKGHGGRPQYTTLGSRIA